MKWQVEEHKEYTQWFEVQEEGLQDEILAVVGVLTKVGPSLSRPLADTLKNSKYPNMKELRVQYGGEPWRILFAFDPTRRAILLVGGNKTGSTRWYKETIPIADRRFAEHLEELQQQSEEEEKKHGHARRKDGSAVPRKKGKNRGKNR